MSALQNETETEQFQNSFQTVSKLFWNCFISLCEQLNGARNGTHRERSCGRSCTPRSASWSRSWSLRSCTRLLSEFLSAAESSLAEFPAMSTTCLRKIVVGAIGRISCFPWVGFAGTLKGHLRKTWNKLRKNLKFVLNWAPDRQGWVRRPLWVNQPSQLSLLPSVGRGMSSI